MKAYQLKQDLYWAGVLDKDLRVFDIIMETEFGTTYNSYVLKGSEKTAVFETAKVKFFDEYLEKLQEVVNVNDIDYVVMNHTEPDHAGSIVKLIEMNPRICVVATACAIGFLKNIINHDFYSIAVKENDTISLGNKTLQFMLLPNLHWPDTMYTYVKEDKLLFTCDSFGSHYCLDDIVLSKLKDNEGYMRATKYYFDNIIGPFKPFMLKALDRIKDLDIDMICTGHGPVIDSRIEEIQKTYKDWCTVVNPNAKKTVIIPYVSAYGYTGQLAEEIKKGIQDSGDIDVRIYDMVVSDQAKVLEELGFADGILFGTPTIVGEALKPIWDLTTSIFAGTHGGKLASAFGSYGWSGEGVPHIIERLKQLRMKVIDGYKIKLRPGENDLTGAYEYGYNFGCVLLNKENDKLKSAKKALVKCLVCGEIFPEGMDTCPVCGVGKENFVSVEVTESDYQKDTEEKFVVIGNGIAGLNAAKEIRNRNKTASITMVTNEPYMSYNRPMLTKTLLAGVTAKQLVVEDQQWYEQNNIEVMLSEEVKSLDSNKKEITLASGAVLSYDKCVYALGAECFVPPIKGADKKEVITIRRMEDVDKVRKLVKTAKNAVVIGGGVLGLEAAWEIKKANCNVTIVEMMPSLMSRQLDSEASDIILKAAQSQGVVMKLGASVESIEGESSVTGVRLSDGEIIAADVVIISSGVRANVEIAKQAGAEINRAIVVNEKMETSLKDVYACGDCAEYDNINYALWSEAAEMGKVAGANAAGEETSYKTIVAPLAFHGMDTSLYAIGDNGKNANRKYKTVVFKDEAKHTFEKYYFANNRLVGVTLIGDTSKMAKVTQALEKPALFNEMF